MHRTYKVSVTEDGEYSLKMYNGEELVWDEVYSDIYYLHKEAAPFMVKGSIPQTLLEALKEFSDCLKEQETDEPNEGS